MRLLYCGGSNPVITDIQSRIKGESLEEIEHSLLNDISPGELETLVDWYEQVKEAGDKLKWGFLSSLL